jgi:nucleotide-binding universal stress UspA family protein
MMAALPEWTGAVHAADRDLPPVRNIVLALDGTERTQGAIPVAETLCALYQAKFHIVYLGEQRLSGTEARNRLRLSDESVPSPHIVQGGSNPVDLIARLTRELPGALTVISTELGAASEKDRFGSVTESLFSSRPERAVIVNPDREQTAWRLHHILLAHDGTPASDAATSPAIDLALRSKAEVIALHVASRGQERPEEAGSISAPLYADQPQHEWPAWAQEFMNRVLASGAPASSIRFKLAVTGGQPGSEVAQVARDRNVDLVVMAWHGHWDRESCATRVAVRNSRCPVWLAYAGNE